MQRVVSFLPQPFAGVFLGSCAPSRNGRKHRCGMRLALNYQPAWRENDIRAVLFDLYPQRELVAVCQRISRRFPYHFLLLCLLKRDCYFFPYENQSNGMYNTYNPMYFGFGAQNMQNIQNNNQNGQNNNADVNAPNNRNNQSNNQNNQNN